MKYTEITSSEEDEEEADEDGDEAASGVFPRAAAMAKVFDEQTEPEPEATQPRRPEFFDRISQADMLASETFARDDDAADSDVSAEDDMQEWNILNVSDGPRCSIHARAVVRHAAPSHGHTACKLFTPTRAVASCRPAGRG